MLEKIIKDAKKEFKKEMLQNPNQDELVVIIETAIDYVPKKDEDILRVAVENIECKNFATMQPENYQDVSSPVILIGMNIEQYIEDQLQKYWDNELMDIIYSLTE